MVKEIIEDFCIATSDLDEEEILVAINEDRVASGFAEVSYDALEQELQNIHHRYKQILHAFLDRLDSRFIVDVLTALIEDATCNGEEECEWALLDDIISDYEIDVIPFFEKQEEIIDQDIDILTEFMQSKASFDELQKNPPANARPMTERELADLGDKMMEQIREFTNNQ